MENMDIRTAIMAAGLRNYMIADQMEIQESNFSRMLRRPISEDQRRRVYEAIEHVKSKRQAGH